MKEQQNCWSDDPGEIQHTADQKRPVLQNAHLLSTTCSGTSLPKCHKKPCFTKHAVSMLVHTDTAPVTAMVKVGKEQKTRVPPNLHLLI